MKTIASYKKSFIGKTIIALTSAIICIGMISSSALAADVTASINVASAYVWRGQTFNDGAVVQPSIDVAAENGLGINVWANYDADDYNNTLDDHEFSEVDLTAIYGITLGKVDLGAGVIAYLFPASNNELHTSEVYLSAGLEIIEGLSASITGYYDIDRFQEFAYGTLGLTYGYDFSEELGLELGASIGYAGDEFAKAAGGADGGMYDYTVSASMGYTISDAWSLSAGVTYVDAVDDDNLKDKAAGGLLDTNTYFYVGISYSFK
ncbi:MAG: MltA-interacting MipA family protein [Pseudomonadota bacterium]